MKLKHTIAIPTEENTDPFQNCKLGRKPYAEVLTQIAENYADGFVLALNNEWGAGKTTFIKMWRQDLMNKGFKTLFYNAWENDFEKNVLVALISELKELVDSRTKKVFKKVIDNAAPFTTKLLPSLAKNLATTYIGEDFVKDLVSGLAEVTSESLKTELQEYADRKKGLKEFRKSLEEFVKLADPEKPVIFFIDELDRCRPNYAVEVLEEVKHLFSVPGIIFVLSIDKVQLGHAVRGAYGSENINSDEYLRRFIDIEYRIPEPNIQLFIEYLYEYYDFDSFLKSEERNASRDFSQDADRLKILSTLFFSRSGFTLRHLEKIFARIRLTMKTFYPNQYVFPELMVFLAFLHEKHDSVYRKIQEVQYSLQELATDMDEVIGGFEQVANHNQVLNLYASVLQRYYNDYSRIHRKSKEELIIYNKSSFNPEMGITSRLEDENHSLAKAVSRLDQQLNTSDIGISWILNRYNLAENFRT